MLTKVVTLEKGYHNYSFLEGQVVYSLFSTIERSYGMRVCARAKLEQVCALVNLFYFFSPGEQ